MKTKTFKVFDHHGIVLFYFRIDRISTATIMQRIPKKSESVNVACIISTVAAVAVTGSTDAEDPMSQSHATVS